MPSLLTSTYRRRSFVLSCQSLVLSLLWALVFAGCSDSEKPTGPEPDEPEYIEMRVVTVGPTLVRCYGVGPMSCMVVDGELFYGGIEGFEHEAGYTYRLRIGKYDPWGGMEPPQDAGRYGYRLLELLEKTPAPSASATLSVGPARVICAPIDDFCLVVDGAPYGEMITGFDYEAGYHYVIEANRFSDGRYVLSEIVSKTRAVGTEEEITIDWGRVECGDGYPGYCKVYNGAPYRGEIVGFQPRHEYGYRLRVEKFSMFPDDKAESPEGMTGSPDGMTGSPDGMTGSPDGMTGSPIVPEYGYRWLETLEETQGG